MHLFKSINTNSHSIRALGMKTENTKNLLTSFNVPTSKDHKDRLHTGTLNILSSFSTVIVVFFVFAQLTPMVSLILLEFVGQFAHIYIVVRLLIAFYDAVHNLSVHVLSFALCLFPPFLPYHKTKVFLIEPMLNQLIYSNSKRMLSARTSTNYKCNA